MIILMDARDEFWASLPPENLQEVATMDPITMAIMAVLPGLVACVLDKERFGQRAELIEITGVVGD
jgi:hypothetical protein